MALAISSIKHRCILLLLILFCTSSSVGLAADSNRISVVTELFDRYQLIDDNNVLTGYSVDVINQLFAHFGDKPDIRVYPWSVAYRKAQQKPNVMIFSMDRNSQRENKFHWIGKLNQEPIFFWSLDTLDASDVTRLDQLKPFTIAVVKDANAHRHLIDNGFRHIYLMTSTFSNTSEGSRLKMLNGSRSDLVIASEYDIVNTIGDVGLKRQDIKKVFHDPQLDNNLHIAMSLQTDMAVVNKFREAYEHLLKSGELDRIRTKWGLSSPWETPD